MLKIQRLKLLVTATSRKTLARHLHPAIPTSPAVETLIRRDKLPAKTRIDTGTIEHLERISLVDFANVEGIERLEQAIELADVIRTVDTEGVDPMYSVLENETLYLREDIAQEPDCRRELLKLATVTEEDYYVAPQGNIPLASSAQDYQRPEE